MGSIRPCPNRRDGHVRRRLVGHCRTAGRSFSLEGADLSVGCAQAVRFGLSPEKMHKAARRLIAPAPLSRARGYCPKGNGLNFSRGVSFRTALSEITTYASPISKPFASKSCNGDRHAQAFDKSHNFKRQDEWVDWFVTFGIERLERGPEAPQAGKRTCRNCITAHAANSLRHRRERLQAHARYIGYLGQ